MRRMAFRQNLRVLMYQAELVIRAYWQVIPLILQLRDKGKKQGTL